MGKKSYNREIALFMLLFVMSNGIGSWWYDNALEVFKASWTITVPVVAAQFGFKAWLQSKEKAQ